MEDSRETQVTAGGVQEERTMVAAAPASVFETVRDVESAVDEKSRGRRGVCGGGKVVEAPEKKESGELEMEESHGGFLKAADYAEYHQL